MHTPHPDSVSADAYSAPSIVMQAEQEDGSFYVFDDFRWAVEVGVGVEVCGGGFSKARRSLLMLLVLIVWQRNGKAQRSGW